MATTFSKDVILDPHTFGGTKACEVLVDMMNHHVISIFEKHKVLSFMNRIIYQFHEISFIPSKGVREHVMFIIRDENINRINQMPYPIKFRSYMKNVVYHHSRRILESVK